MSQQTTPPVAPGSDDLTELELSVSGMTCGS